MKIPNGSKPLPKIIVAVPKNALDFYDPVSHFPKPLRSPDKLFPSMVIKEKKRRSRGEREKALHHLGFGPPEPTGPAGRPTPPPTGRSLPFLFLCSVSLQGQGRPRPPRRPQRERIRATPQAPLISPHPLALPTWSPTPPCTPSPSPFSPSLSRSPPHLTERRRRHGCAIAAATSHPAMSAHVK